MTGAPAPAAPSGPAGLARARSPRAPRGTAFGGPLGPWRGALVLLCACGDAPTPPADTGADTGAGDTARNDTARGDTAPDSDETGLPGAWTHPAGILAGGARWGTGTHEVLGDLEVVDGLLEIDPCATITMAPGSTLTVGAGGGLRALGGAQCPVVFLAASGEPGAWGGIGFTGTSAGELNALEHVTVLHAGASRGDAGAGPAIHVRAGASVAIARTTVRSALGVGVRVEDTATLRRFDANVLQDGGDVGLEIAAVHAGLLAPGLSAGGEGAWGPNAVEGVRVRGTVPSGDARWRALGVPWRLPEGLRVQGGTLTLAPGVDLRLGRGTDLTAGAGGGLRLEGTADAPVTLGSDATTAAAGDWGAVALEAGALPLWASWTDLRYGGGVSTSGDAGQVRLAAGTSATFADVRFLDGGACDVAVAEGATLEDAGGARRCVP